MIKKVKMQIMQFSFIGLLNAGVDIGSLNLFLLIWPTDKPMTLLMYNTISYVLAIINSYFWNTKYTFRQHANLDFKEIGLFLLQAVAALIVNNAVFIGLYELLLYIDIVPLPNFILHNISKGVAMFLSFSTSFFLLKFIVFKRTKKHSEG
ncbi:GtrA family protein [Sediminibacillus massiliensis]|uniref:GtrA family protein n=1 Tax=Sediminibacillus massiliensis TaxID=1926277 RepID=UPI0009885CB6|nr:GtrA family protein [Sediminibacillus massiliensis]